MTRQEMAYLDAEVEMLHKHIEDGTACNTCDGTWCIGHSSLVARIKYSQKYGCICGCCCRLCMCAEDCLSGDDEYMSCTDCALNCGVNPNK